MDSHLQGYGLVIPQIRLLFFLFTCPSSDRRYSMGMPTCGMHMPLDDRLHQERKKIASTASGRTRRSRRSGRNLATPDAAHQGTVRRNATRQGTVHQDTTREGTCARTQLPRHLSSGRRVSRHLPSGRGVSGHLPSDAVRSLQTESVKANVVRRTRATASAFRTRSVIRTQRVSYRRRVSW